MKKMLPVLILIIFYQSAYSQTTFSVGGDINKFYPVVFVDGKWDSHVPTELQIGRSNTHQGGNWLGTFMMKLTFHCTNWGNGSNFINADLVQGAGLSFVAGYVDCTQSNSSFNLIVWLKGNTIYNFTSNASQNPIVYDGVQNALPFQEINGPAHTFKTAVDSYVNSNGVNNQGSIYSQGSNLNYMNGNLGLGTLDTRGYKLAVNGNILAREIKVDNQNWPDYVFKDDYRLPSLLQVEDFIKENNHLPGIPSAEAIESEGVNLGDMNAKLLKKIEELTLYLIEQNKQIELLKKKIDQR